MVEGQASLDIYYMIYIYIAIFERLIFPIVCCESCVRYRTFGFGIFAIGSMMNYFGTILRYNNNERYRQNQAAAPMARTRNALSFVHIPSLHDRIGN